MSTEQSAPTQIVPQKDAKLVVQDNTQNSYLMDTARFEHSYRIAKLMASASLLPDHLWMDKAKNALPESQIIGNCFLIVNQSLRWEFDPFAVAPETYSVGGKLGFQGKLIAAVVNSRAGLNGRLHYEFIGEGEKRGVIVSGTFSGDTEPHTVTVMLATVRTGNDMWKRDPDQKLCYTGAIKWARRWCPEVVLGVRTDDDLEAMNEREESKQSSRSPAAEVPDALKRPVVDAVKLTEAQEAVIARLAEIGFTGADYAAQISKDIGEPVTFELISDIDHEQALSMWPEVVAKLEAAKGGKRK